MSLLCYYDLAFVQQGKKKSRTRKERQKGKKNVSDNKLRLVENVFGEI